MTTKGYLPNLAFKYPAFQIELFGATSAFSSVVHRSFRAASESAYAQNAPD